MLSDTLVDFAMSKFLMNYNSTNLTMALNTYKTQITQRSKLSLYFKMREEEEYVLDAYWLN